MRRLLIVLGISLAVPAVAQDGNGGLALPYGINTGSGGMWLLKLWPRGGCEDCVAPEATKARFAQVLDDVRPGGPLRKADATLTVQIVDRVGQTLKTEISLSDLHDRLNLCKLGDHTILPNINHTGSDITYGVFLRCPGHDRGTFVSATFLGGKLMSIYYLPNGPIWLAKPSSTPTPTPSAATNSSVVVGTISAKQFQPQ